MLIAATVGDCPSFREREGLQKLTIACIAADVGPLAVARITQCNGGMTRTGISLMRARRFLGRVESSHAITNGSTV